MHFRIEKNPLILVAKCTRPMYVILIKGTESTLMDIFIDIARRT